MLCAVWLEVVAVFLVIIVVVVGFVVVRTGFFVALVGTVGSFSSGGATDPAVKVNMVL